MLVSKPNSFVSGVGDPFLINNNATIALYVGFFNIINHMRKYTSVIYNEIGGW